MIYHYQELHHSQTAGADADCKICTLKLGNFSFSGIDRFTTIRNYITLKPKINIREGAYRFTTIRNYITLKQSGTAAVIPERFTTIRNYITLKPGTSWMTG